MAGEGKISVIIPVYNGETTIRRACLSVLGQKDRNLELIVVDDGSRDATAAVLREMQEEHANVHCIHQKNGGVCRARNVGLDAAKGDYVMFLDVDDELAPGALSAMRELSARYDCDVVASSCLRIRPDGSRFHSAYPLNVETELWEGEELLLHCLRDHPATYAVWGKLYRRAFIGDIRFEEGKKLHEDSFFLFQLLRQGGTMAVTNQISVHYYLTETSSSRTVFSDKFLDMLYFAEKKYAIIKAEYPQHLALGKNIVVKANMALLKTIWSAEGNTYRDLERQCLKTVRENGAYFIPAITVDKVLFAFIRLRLFWLYKRIYRLYRRRGR